MLSNLSNWNTLLTYCDVVLIVIDIVSFRVDHKIEMNKRVWRSNGSEVK